MTIDQLVAAAKSLANSAQQYPENVAYNKQNLPSPFFNENNTVKEWPGKVIDDVKRRGVFEGLHDLTYPILQNPNIYPYTEPITSAVRVANYKAGKPNNLLNLLLGQ